MEPDKVSYEIIRLHTTTGERFAFLVWYGIKIVAKSEPFKTQQEAEEIIFLMQNVKGWEIEE
jgi:hypothetical protein